MNDIFSKLPDVLEYIKSVAKQQLVSEADDWNPCDYAGGNYDDAYDLGVTSGEIFFARELLRMVENE